MSEPQQANCDPTEKTLYREPHDDHWGAWQDRLFQCGDGPQKGIGIDVGGTVFVKPMKEWHRLAVESETLLAAERRRLIEKSRPVVEALRYLEEKIEDLCDDGPADEMWKSQELITAHNMAKEALAQWNEAQK